MRFAALITLALAALLAMAASAAARDPKLPRLKPVAADVKTAKSIGLLRSDFAAGWKAVPTPKSTPACGVEPDESKLVQTASIDPTFVWQKDKVTQVGSEVDVFRSASEAKLDWRLSTLKLMTACLLESARQGLSKKVAATVEVQSAVALPGPKLGERSLHYRIVIAAQAKNSVPIVAELIGVGVGRISVVLHAFSLLVAPLPASGLNSLTATLAKRLVAASGGI